MALSSHTAWSSARDQLSERLPDRTFANWFAPIVPGKLEEEADSVELTLQIPSRFAKNYVLQYRERLEEALRDAVGRPVVIHWEVNPNLDRNQAQSPQEKSQQSRSVQTTGEDTPNGDLPADKGHEMDAAQEDASAGAPLQKNTKESTRRPSTPRTGDLFRGHEAERVSRSTRGDGSPRHRSNGSSDEDRTSGSSPSSRSGSSSSASSTIQRPRARKRTRREGTKVSGDSVPNRRNGDVAEGDVDRFHFSQARQDLRPEFTFDGFVSGDSNRLAQSAAAAVAQNPGETNYNPLLIYGGVGLGKTHLAQAIAHYAADHQTAEYLSYVSSEEFTSQFVRAIRSGTVENFSKTYQAIDLLIVDDVQFFSKKEKTQEEFFHLFNQLHQKGKQIVLCADRPPRKIEGIEERLLSRFQWGLSADIQRPDMETRLAILQLKADALDLTIGNDVLERMAERLQTNIRQLEGALKQISAHVELTGSSVEWTDVRNLLRDQLDESDRRERLAPDAIKQCVADFYGLSSDDLMGRSRRQELSRARHIAMHFCRQLTSLSYSAIGTRFGGRDHSTVIHACKAVQDRVDTEPGFREELSEVRRAIHDG